MGDDEAFSEPLRRRKRTLTLLEISEGMTYTDLESPDEPLLDCADDTQATLEETIAACGPLEPRDTNRPFADSEQQVCLLVRRRATLLPVSTSTLAANSERMFRETYAYVHGPCGQKKQT